MTDERLRRSWSQQDLAERLGTTPENVSRWERGVTFPSPYYRQKLCDLFQKSAEELGLFIEIERAPSERVEENGASSKPELPLPQVEASLSEPGPSLQQVEASPSAVHPHSEPEPSFFA